MSIRLAALGVLLLFLGLVIAAYAGGPVSRERVERFARRQRLVITQDNGNQVIRYLATTRRWRVAGFVAGFVLSTMTTPEGEILRIDFVTLFVGWFLGALVAEIRVAHLAHGPVRAASLQPRRPARYVSPVAWVLVPAAAIVASGVAVSTGVAAFSGVADPDWTAWAWFSAAVAVAVAVRAIQLTVLRRAQPHAEPDVTAADDAIRSRALHVLAGGGAALVLFLVLRQLSAVHLLSDRAQMTVADVQTVGVFVVAAMGWMVATAIWAPPRPRPGPAALGTQ